MTVLASTEAIARRQQPHSDWPADRFVFTPGMIDLARSPLAGQFDAETYVLGAFNPALTKLANGNLLMMVRVARSNLRRDGSCDPLGEERR